MKKGANIFLLCFITQSLFFAPLHADTYSLAMQTPNGYRIPKVIGASGDLVTLTGYDYFDWFGITHHRTWFKPSISSLPNDGSVNSASAFATASEAIRQNPLRQATSSDYYIDWNHFYSEFNADASGMMQRLTGLGIEPMICDTVFVSNSSITGDWVNIFKYWKSWYAMVYYMASNYDITMYEFRNEPHAWVDYDTWESHWLVAADAMREAMDDVNADYGKNLPLYICGPTEPGPYWNYSLPDPYADVHGWGSVSWAKVKYDIYGNYDVNNPWNYGMYDYHRYTTSGASVETQILDTRADIATALNDPNPDIPLLITEFNTSTGGNFTTKQKDTEDISYGISMSQILQATAGLGPDGLGDEGGFFEFKIAAHQSTGPYEGIQNRVCYTSPHAPYNYGGITRGGVCFQMYARHFRGGKTVIPFNVVSGDDAKRRTIAALDTEKKCYYIYGSNTSGTDAAVQVDLNALDVSAGAPVTVQRVDAYNTGQITERLTLDASKVLSFSAPDMTAYLVTVPKGDSASIETVLDPTADTTQNVADTVIHGSETTMQVSNHHNVPSERRAAFVRFNVNDVDTLNRALLRLSGRNVGVDQAEREILHVYAVSNKNWDENASRPWIGAPGVGRYYINSTTLGNANGLGDMVDIEDNYAGYTSGTGKGLGIYGKFLGAISFYSNAYHTNYLDVTDYLKSVANGSTADVTFVIVRIVRYNVNSYDNPYYYNLGDYHYDGRIVEIASKENANPDLRPALALFEDCYFGFDGFVGFANAWLTSDNMWDVAPLPNGDGIVNLRDFASFACCWSTDNDAPAPNPMTWATAPYGTSASSIKMVATTATDVKNDVEYYFTCTAGGGHDSGWQGSPVYEDTGLILGESYTYTVTARDKSANQNATAPSPEGSVTITVMIDDFTNDTLDSNWIISSVLTSGGSPAIFDTTTNADQLTITYNGGTYHQTVMLRDDYTLAVGETLKVDYVSGEKAGLCLAPTYDPSDRTGMINWYVNPPSSGPLEMKTYYFPMAGGSSSTSYTTDGALVDIFITRTGTNTYETGWTDSGGAKAGKTWTVDGPVPVVGFFSDLRADQSGLPAVFDNLMIE